MHGANRILSKVCCANVLNTMGNAKLGSWNTIIPTRRARVSTTTTTQVNSTWTVRLWTCTCRDKVWTTKAVSVLLKALRPNTSLESASSQSPVRNPNTRARFQPQKRLKYTTTIRVRSTRKPGPTVNNKGLVCASNASKTAVTYTAPQKPP